MNLGYLKMKCKYFISNCVLLVKGEQRKTRKTLEAYKGKYQDKRCFIVCNGPSLTVADLEKLQGEVTFASNRIYNIFPKTSWRPTFFGLFDEGVLHMDRACEGVEEVPSVMKFFRAQGWWDSRNIGGPKCYIHSWYDRKYLDYPNFSEDLTKGIYTIATVTYSLIQIARYMGFSQIYIIGADNRYKHMQTRDGKLLESDTKSYFGDQKDTSKQAPAAVWEMNAAYEYAEKYSRENGFRIYNATRGGCLESFERVDFDSLF